MSIRPEAARLLTQISRLLAARNIRAYIAGGFVRDTLLARAGEVTSPRVREALGLAPLPVPQPI